MAKPEIARNTCRVVAAAILASALAALTGGTPAVAETVEESQWYLGPLHVAQAQQISTGVGVTVAVIDGVGIDNTQPDLQGQLLAGTAIGVNAPNGWSSSAEADHATAMAALIAGKGGGDMHFLGIAPGAKILPVALPANGSVGFLAKGIQWACDHGATVISISLAADGESAPELTEAIRYALAKDVVVVAGAGNHSDGNYRVGFPARIPGVVAVAGADRNVNAWSESAAGPEVAIAAPATEITTPVPKAASTTGYSRGSGTSYATPIVAGTAALIRAKHPNLNAANVINRLVKTAKDQGTPGRDDQYGFGTIRIEDALTADVPLVEANPLGTPAANSAQAPSPDPSTKAAAPSAAPTSRAGETASAGNHTALLAAGIGGSILVLCAGILAMMLIRRRKTSPVGTAPGISGPGYPGAGYPALPGQLPNPGPYGTSGQHPNNWSL